MTDNQEIQSDPAPAEEVTTDPAGTQDNEAPSTENVGDPGEKQAPEDDSGQEQEDLLFDDKEGEKEDSDSEDGDEAEGEEGEDGDNEEEKSEEVDIEALEIPEDMPVPDDLKGDLDQLMKDLTDKDLSPQEKAQKIINAHVKSQKHALQVWDQTKKEWREDTLSDEEIGGKNWEQSQRKANQAIRAIWANEQYGGSEELLESFQQDLKFLGLGNKKSFIKGMVNLSKMIGEDSGGDGESSGAQNELSAAERLYGKDGQGRK